MIEIILIILGGAIGIGGTYYGYRLARSDSREIIKITEFNNAISKFRSSIIYELSGFYPIEQGWHKEDFHRLYESIPRINSAAAEFRIYVTCKGKFDSTIEEYNKYCRETKENDAFPLLDLPSMENPGDIKPKERFKNIVDHLLSFTIKD